MPTITQLEYIIAVDKWRHFGRAAEACHVSQPSLSMQIQKVEEHLGITIFDRDKKPVVPTDAGKRFIKQAHFILSEHQKLIEISHTDANTISGSFKLGIIPTLAPYVIPLFIKNFSENYPQVELFIDELKTETIIEQLRQDQLDGAVLATPLHEAGLFEEVLFYEPFYLYTSENSSLANKKRIKETDLEKNNIWLLEDGHCFKNQIVNFCSLKDAGQVFPNIHFAGGNLETLRYIIQKSKGYTLIPHLFAETLPAKEKEKYVKAFTAPIPTREVSFVYRRGTWKEKVIEALVQSIKRSLPQTLSDKLNSKSEVIEITK